MSIPQFYVHKSENFLQNVIYGFVGIILGI